MTVQAVSIKVGCKIYRISNAWNSLFICGGQDSRRMTALSVFEQLRADKYKGRVEARLLSQSPMQYEGGTADAFDAELLEEYLKEMDRRYTLLAESEARNYIHYNQKREGENLKLLVLIVDGAETVVGAPLYLDFLEKLHILVQKSRAVGIHVVSLVNGLPSEAEEYFKYYGRTVNVMHKRFFAKDATNVIVRELYSLGFFPILNVSHCEEEDTVWLEIDLELEGAHLSFSYAYDAHEVKYALLFPIRAPIDFDTRMEIYRTLRTDCSQCYDSFSDDYREDRLALTGSRWISRITPPFVRCMVEESGSMRTVKMLKTLQNSDALFNET